MQPMIERRGRLRIDAAADWKMLRMRLIVFREWCETKGNCGLPSVVARRDDSSRQIPLSWIAFSGSDG
jgi:hypothetical protein